MRKLTKTQKVTVALAAGALGVAGSGVAYAWWSTTGSGTGTASTRAGDVASMLITGGAGAVSPGTAAAAISGTVTNTGTSAGYVNTVSASVVSTSNAACDATNFSVTGTSTPAVDVPAGQSTPFSGQSLNFVNKASNQDACKGVTVNLAFSSN